MPATRGRSSGGRLAEVKNLTDGEHVRYIQPHQFAHDASEGRWKPYRHLAYLGRILARELWGPRRGARLVVSMPPRSGKSEAISRRIPEWLLYWNPETRIILTSYEADFAAEWGRKVRNDLLERPDFFGVKIRDDSSAADRWHTTAGGGMVTAGVGGAITGRGGDILVVDDYCKNWEQAMSETYRKRTIEWFESTLYTRAEPGASIVVLATRWHEADLIGYLLNEHADPWLEVRLPALAEENDPLGRPVGAALCPERYDEAALLRIKAAVAPMVWEGLYQQRPAPQDGGLFKRGMFRRFRLHDAGEARTLELLTEDGPKVYRMQDCKVFQTCDVAGSLKAHADFFALGTWALCPGGELALLDIFRDRLEGPDQPALLMRKFAEWRPMVQAIEAKSMGLTLYQSMVRSGLPILELNPGTRDKYTRALSMASRYHAGMVYHREGAPWLDELEKELVAFPNAAHDDQTDVVSYAGDVVEWVLTGRDPNGGVYVID